MIDLTLYAPGEGNSVAVGAASTAAQDLGASTTKILLKVTEGAHIRFGSATVGAADTDDYLLTAGQDYVLDIKPDRRFFRVIRNTTDGILYWVAV